jgi:hypothetical protein
LRVEYLSDVINAPIPARVSLSGVSMAEPEWRSLNGCPVLCELPSCRSKRTAYLHPLDLVGCGARFWISNSSLPPFMDDVVRRDVK